MSTIDRRELFARFAGETEGGTYFVSNYPPFTAWSADAITSPPKALTLPGRADTPLGVYVHVPFCRKRCHFCYFKVYTGRNAREVDDYIDAVIAEAQMLADAAVVQGRPVRFLYVGGGTPSYLSARQLRRLIEGLTPLTDRTELEEFTLECEPGTVSPAKLEVLADLGVTRLSLGVESLDDTILEGNGRAHRLQHVDRVWATAKASGIPQLNVDLISGLVGETDATWRGTLDRLVGMNADSVTIYQMEMPTNTTFFKARGSGDLMGDDVPDWPTKRRWSTEAFDALADEGYTLTSAVTAVRARTRSPFVYRDSLWGGADMLGLGVSAFSHVAGTHYQNEKHIERYIARVGEGELPVQRGYVMNDDERLIRETVLLLKTGKLDLARLERRYSVDPSKRFASALAVLVEEGLASRTDDEVTLSKEALLQVDRLLPAFFDEVHQPQAMRRRVHG
ncbi:MAG: coproporphyrinogen-III oxidase family protein [Myxococcota bacterium]